MQKTIRSCSERLIRALSPNKYEKSPIAKFIAQLMTHNSEFVKDLLLALVNECCSLIRQNRKGKFYTRKSDLKTFNAKPLG